MTQSAAALSGLLQPEFVAALDGIYEHSPWVAEAAWAARPFATLADLHAALAEAVARADPAAQLGLIRAHPELAGQQAAQHETAELSRREQGGAGLDQCSPGELARLRSLNATYAAKFGFPFVIAVRGHTRGSIIAALAARVEHGREAELRENLRQIERIALLRLRGRFGDFAS